MDFIIDKNYVTRTLVDLVRINSCNPSLSPDGPGEAQIGTYLAREMSALGLQVEVHELAPGRVNVVGVLPGSGGGRSLMWNAHMDTVGVQGMAEPFSGCLRDGRVYGRGAQDMKGSLAAMLAAAKSLRDAGIVLPGDLVLAAVADEEYASMGTQDLVRRYCTDAAIVTEPTSLTPSRAHRGFIWFDIETTGRAAHGSRYDEGIDAIMHMGRFLTELDRLEQELRARSPHPLAGPPSLHASMITGGSEISIYPAHCRLQVERRTAPGETLESASAELQSIVERLSASDPTFQAVVWSTLERQPFTVDEDALIVRHLDAALTARLGAAVGHTGATFWTDAALLAAAGIESVLFGPTGSGLHSAEEWVDLQSVFDLAYILADTARAYCR